MEQQQKEISAIILLQIENVMMHRFVKGTKALFTSGNIKMAKIENPQSNTVYFLNVNSFYYTLNKSIVFIKLEYPDTVSYLFPHFDQGMSALTLPLNCTQISAFEIILQNSAVLTTYQTAILDPNLKDKIQQHCPNVYKEQIYCPDKVKQIISTSGKYLGYAFTAIGGLLSKGIQKSGEFINSHLSEGYTEIKPQTKEKWEDIKKGTNKVFTISVNFLSTIATPVINKGKEVTQKITSNIQKSQNPNVIYAREIAQTSGKAINEAFQGLAVGTKQVVGQLGSQSKKIITKKFGQDVVNTITGNNNPPISQPIPMHSEQRLIQKTNEQQNHLNTSSQVIYPKIEEVKKEEVKKEEVKKEDL